jgi:hypothetical protein
MKQNNLKPIEFDVICGDDKLILESLSSYNETYKTDFEVTEFIYDEVIFAKLKATRYEISDIFYLGYQFGGYAEYKRKKGEIDW